MGQTKHQTPYRALYIGGEDIDLPPNSLVTVLRVYMGDDDGPSGVAKVAFTPDERDDMSGEGIWEVGMESIQPRDSRAVDADVARARAGRSAEALRVAADTLRAVEDGSATPDTINEALRRLGRETQERALHGL